MLRRTVKITTASREMEFDIDELRGDLIVFAIHLNEWGARQSRRIGVAKTLDNAVTLIRIHVSEPIVKMQIRPDASVGKLR